ncbi:YqaJ viral recombinase family nuclease [Thermomonospora cellulosilytica]|uniref:Putative phage-type endonuclease n=1 Tax=Thermomonospora cellulosilytica TaxID=1411118 RepID=A0A7W3RA42_9ACTN|nr:YqaJ viral recombinase family protein [Thermomonospora cellulosilytica]MBA9006013.1 putative phage-type endonuclease [Thermomonospora cellulosilytica]
MTPALLQADLGGMCQVLLEPDAPRPVWLQARRTGIGGSEALACLGLDPDKSRLEVYLDKLGRLPERRPNNRMRWGQIVEPAIREWFTERTGLPVVKPGMLRSRQRPWQLANVDGLTPDGGVLEIKNTNYWRRGEWTGDEVADGAEAQSQHYMDVTGRTHAWVIAQVGGEPPVIRRVERDEGLIADIRLMEADLWQRVVDRNPPPLEGEAAEDLVDRLFPTGIPGKRVDVDEAFMALLEEYSQVHEQWKSADARKAELRAQMSYEMGEATEAYHDGVLVATRNNRAKARADIKALRERHPDAAADTVTETRYRQFDSKILRKAAR